MTLINFSAHCCYVLALLLWLGFFGVPAKAQIDPENEVQLQQLAYSKPWLRLLHYIQDGRAFRSELDGQAFFLHQAGRTDPLAELKAAIESFHSEKPIGKLAMPAQCAFPERFRFIRENVKINYSLFPCPKFDEFLKRFHRPTGVTLVFSSAYPNNPASSFGHSFLKFRSERKNKLLDVGMNFAAYSDPNTNMLSFIYHGLFGGYLGVWSTESYFVKVNEYVNAESRDLWEYELNLSESEVLRLIAHIWEMEVNSHFDYFFFDENCSYQVLRAIEAIRTDWEISQHRIYVIPGETIKRVMDVPSAVKEVNFRQSLFHQLQARYAQLSEMERHQLDTLIDESKGKKQVDAKEVSPQALDAALLYYLYRKAQKKKKWSDEDQANENRILELRVINSVPAAELRIPSEHLLSRPDIGHDPYSVHLTMGYLSRPGFQDGAFGRMKIRSAYHDLLAQDVGYPPFSEIEFPWVEVQWHDHELRLSELGGIRTSSFFPMTFFNSRPSWQFQIGGFTNKMTDCLNCFLPTFSGGFGATVGGLRQRLYVLALGQAEFHDHFDQAYRIRPVLEAGGIWQANLNYKTRVRSRVLWGMGKPDYSRTYELSWENAFHLQRNEEVRQSFLAGQTSEMSRPAWSEAQLQWIKYFR
jgi:hypothetical protein